MNLRDSIQAAQLMEPRAERDKCLCDAAKVSAREITRRIFAEAEKQGQPYDMEPERWQRRWLSSKEFVLLRVPARQVAVPFKPQNPNRVLENLKASADAQPPIVVDLNKRQVGGSLVTGYVPPVIAVDGKHRYMGQMLQGRAWVRAWVGTRALKHLKLETGQIDLQAAAENVPATRLAPLTKMDAAMSLYAGLGGTPVPRQDVGDGGSQPTMRMPAVKSTGKPMEPYSKGQKPQVLAEHKDGCNCEVCKEKREMRAKCKMNAVGNSGAGTGGAAGTGGGAATSTTGGTGGPGGSTSGANPLRRGFEGTGTSEGAQKGWESRQRDTGKTARAYGYKPSGGNPRATITHYQSKGGHLISHNATTDQWTHIEDGGHKTGSGTGSASLNDHLMQLKHSGGGYFEAGGPGSGRRPGGGMGKTAERYEKSSQYVKDMAKGLSKGPKYQSISQVPVGSTFSPRSGKITPPSFDAEADASDTESVVDPSDTKYPPDPSDRKMGKYPAAQTSTGKCETNDTESDGIEKHPYQAAGTPRSPSNQSPGSGVGPRWRATGGATTSDLNRSGRLGRPSKLGGATTSDLSKVMNAKGLKSGGLHVDQMWHKKKKKMQAKSPPGWKKTTEEMKDHPEIDNPFALAHWMDKEGYTPGGKGNGKKKMAGTGTSEGAQKGWEGRRGRKVNPGGYFPGSGQGFLGKPEETKKEAAKKDEREPWGYGGPRNMEGVAPPGMSEKDMHSLKRKYGTASAFKVAWAIHKDKSGKRRAMESAFGPTGGVRVKPPSLRTPTLKTQMPKEMDPGGREAHITIERHGTHYKEREMESALAMPVARPPMPTAGMNVPRGGSATTAPARATPTARLESAKRKKYK